MHEALRLILAEELAPIHALLREIHFTQGSIMSDLSDLQASVAAEDTVIQSAITLIQGFSAQLAAAGTDPVALAALKSDIDAHAASLASAVAANTPATAPAPAAAPVAAPVAAPAAASTVAMETVPVVGGVPVQPSGSSTAADPSGAATATVNVPAEPYVQVPSLPVDATAAPAAAPAADAASTVPATAPVVTDPATPAA